MKTFIIEDKQRIESIILHCDACFVGITDLEGNPYVVPRPNTRIFVITAQIWNKLQPTPNVLPSNTNKWNS